MTCCLPFKEHMSGGIGRKRKDLEVLQDLELQAFFCKVEEIKVDMNEIKTRQRQLQQMLERIKSIVHQKEMQQHREQMQVSLQYKESAQVNC
jgi:paraquat-inducible protein B